MMSSFKDIFDKEYFSIIISIIWGIGLAVLFKKNCLNDQCVIVKSPPLLNQNNTIYSKNKCYKLVRYNSKCEY